MPVSRRLHQELLLRLATACPGRDLGDLVWNAELLAQRRGLRPGDRRGVERCIADAILVTLDALAEDADLECPRCGAGHASEFLKNAEIV